MTMMLNCDNLKDIVQSFSLVDACDVIKSGALRIATPFKYPNGSQIDLFLKPTNDLFGNYLLSDLGQTADYVADMQFNLFATKKRRVLIDDICESLGVKQSEGGFAILIPAQEIASLPNAIVRLAQACIRATDLVFTQRLQSSGTFQEEIEEFLATHQLLYESDVELPGRYNNLIKVDFKVRGERLSSLVQTLSTRTNAHVVSNEVFRRWHDLEPYRLGNQFMTIYDEASDNYRADDLSRLSEYSLVLGYPNEQDRIFEALAA